MLYYDINKKMYFGGHMSIKEEIHALSDEMITNLEDWLRLTHSLVLPQKECPLVKDLPRLSVKDLK